VHQGFAQKSLGAYLLTRLEERLLASAPARVIAVGSSTNRLVKGLEVDRPTLAEGILRISRAALYQSW
jgi:hypothetical protein